VRHDVNTDFYGHRINVGAALEGGLPRPHQLNDAQELYAALKTLTGDKAPLAMAEPLSPPAARAASRDESQSQHGKSQGSWSPPRDSWAPTVNPFSELPLARSAEIPQAQAAAVASTTPLPQTAQSYGIGGESDGEVEEFSV